MGGGTTHLSEKLSRKTDLLRWQEKIGQHRDTYQEPSLQNPPLLRELVEIIEVIYAPIGPEAKDLFKILRDDNDKIIIDARYQDYFLQTTYNNPHTQDQNTITIRQKYQPAQDDEQYGANLYTS